MGIAKSLTNDLERGLRLYRLPILTAIALSLRQLVDDRFLLTDSREEDERRNVLKLRRVSKLEVKTCQPGVGVDDRQFTSMTNLLVFTGLKDENGVVQPIGNVNNLGGLQDPANVLYSATGTAEQKQDKIERYSKRRPGDVSWRVRTPIMMAEYTSIMDYLALRCTQLPFLHSVAIKWSDRRWDASTIGLDEDLYRQEGERTNMVILPPMWMDPTRRFLDPSIWGPYQSLIEANYAEYMGRKADELKADCEAFIAAYQSYAIDVLYPTSPESHGRVQRRLDTNLNKTLHITFNRNIHGDGDGNDTYRITPFDPKTGQDVTQDIYNLQDAANQFRLTSSFESDDLEKDGWFGTATASYQTDIPLGLPPYTTDRASNPVYGTKSMKLANGFMTRRMVLPDGKYCLSFWVKNVTGNEHRIEIVRNTRLKPKSQFMAGDRESSAIHYREAYETVAVSEIRRSGDWSECFICFDLVDHFLVTDEPYPKHEIFIVFKTDGEMLVDHLNLYLSQLDHVLRIFNTVNRSTLPYTVRPELRHVDLEHAFQTETADNNEKASSFFRFDGANVACELESRDSYNLHETGTTINAWFRINSADEQKHKVLSSRGSFTLFQKTGVNVPGYTCTVDLKKNLSVTYGSQSLGSSSSFHNHFLHPSVGNQNIQHRTDWSNLPSQYENFIQAFTLTGKQPMEWVDFKPVANPVPPRTANGPALNGGVTALGADKTLIITSNDPYLSLVYNPDLPSDLAWAGAAGYYPDGTASVALAGQCVDLNLYLLYHAKRAYGMVVPAQDVAPVGTNTGFVFLPTPSNVGLSGTSQMKTRKPAVLNGAVEFDKWFNLSIIADMNGWSLIINGSAVSSGDLSIFGSVKSENQDRLLIGNATPEAINGGAPISVYAFKIFQSALSQDDLFALINEESSNFNDIQFAAYADYIDIDGNNEIDFWQDDLTDYGLWMTKTSQGTSPGNTSPETAFGRISVSVPDVLTFRPDFDRDRTTIADWYDSSYLQELIDIQVAGFGDGLLLWDFLHRDQDYVHGYKDRIWNGDCRYFTERFLSYYDWLQGVLTDEWNSVTSVHDPIPNQPDGSPLPDPSPYPSPKPENSPSNVFGDQDSELVMTGVKGWFGFSGLMGYRDSLELLRKEGMIFNYLQIEFRFQAPREELETLLRDFAKSYEQVLEDDYPRNRLATRINR